MVVQRVNRSVKRSRDTLRESPCRLSRMTYHESRITVLYAPNLSNNFAFAIM